MKLAPNPFLSDYLAEHVKEGVIDFALRASLDSEGSVNFYIHPAHASGRTEDYHLQPGKVEVYNKRGLDALIAAAMKPRRQAGNKVSMPRKPAIRIPSLEA